MSAKISIAANEMKVQMGTGDVFSFSALWIGYEISCQGNWMHERFCKNAGFKSSSVSYLHWIIGFPSFCWIQQIYGEPVCFVRAFFGFDSSQQVMNSVFTAMNGEEQSVSIIIDCYV